MPQEDTPRLNQPFLKFLTTLFKEVGLLGFVVIFLTFLFLVWGTSEQKRLFIDSYILLRSEEITHCVVVTLTLLAILVISSIYNYKIGKLRKEENNRIGQEKSALQKALLRDDLNTSD